MKISLILLTVLIGLSIFASSSLALTIPPLPGGGAPNPSNISDIQGLYAVVTRILGWVYTLFFVGAALFILFAAFTYLTSGGDPEKVGNAKNQIIYAAIAIVVALLAFALDRIVANFL